MLMGRWAGLFCKWQLFETYIYFLLEPLAETLLQQVSCLMCVVCQDPPTMHHFEAVMLHYLLDMSH